MPPKHRPGRGRPKKTAMRDDKSDKSDSPSEGSPTGSASPTSPPMTPRKTRQKRVAYALLSWDDLPAWRRDNVYVQTGYRPTSHSYIASFASVLAIHNESVNIWTHLGGAIVAALLGLTLYIESSAIAAYWASLNHTLPTVASWLAATTATALTATGLDDLVQPLVASSTAAGDPSATLVLSCFAGGAIACLGMSATYHALSNHSPAVARWGNKLDYTGIVFLIVGSYVPTLYYGFFCHKWWMTVYLYSIGILGTACLVVSWLEHFRTPAWRPYRAMLFVGLGASGVVPIVHSLLFLEPGATLGARYASINAKIGLEWVLLQGALYIAGAFLYGARWPERQWPGKFDIWGSSHQIFHVFVVAAAAAHLRGVLQAYMHHHQQYHVLGQTCPAI